MAVCLPLPHIATHVVDAEPVCREAGDGRGFHPLIASFHDAATAIDKANIGFVMTDMSIITFDAAG